MFGLLNDIVNIAVAPVKIAADVARVVTKPVADMATELSDTIKETVDDLIE
jgi:hypothetical protein